MKTVSLLIEGMHCGACVGRVDKALRGVAGVAEAGVNLAANTARVRGEAEVGELVEAVERAGYGARVLGDLSAETLREIGRRGEEGEKLQRDRVIYGVLFGVPAVVVEMGAGHFVAGHWQVVCGILAALLATGVMGFTGWGFFVRGLRSARRVAPDMDTLIALGAGTAYGASLVSLVIWLCGEGHGVAEFHAAVVIVVLVALGKYLEARAKRRANSAVAGLSAQSSPRAGRVRADGSVEEIAAEEIRMGDRLQVLAHQQLPVDGRVVEGAGSLDLSVVTGEGMPVEVVAGGEAVLPGGATLADGRIVMVASSTAGESTVARILELVQGAQAGKTRIQSLADRVAGIFVPIVLGLGVMNFLGWVLVGHDWRGALLTTIATVVIACPCAMGLATPTAITVAIGRAAKLGILFTNAGALESARSITTVLFDKTGTLTGGVPEVVQILGRPETLRIAASMEQFSEHPMARAVVAKAAAEKVALSPPTGFRSVAGGGVGAVVEGREYAAGSASYIGSLGIAGSGGAGRGEEPKDAMGDARALGLVFPHEAIGGGKQLRESGESEIFLADVGARVVVGTITLRDALRADATAAVQALHDRGFQIGVLTGDTEAAAKGALADMPINFVRARVRPEEKAGVVADLKARGGTGKFGGVAFVGDGINDAPALAAADLGIAMGGGADLAKAAGDVILLSPRLGAIPQALELSRRTVGIVRQNLFWAFAYNVAAIPLAMLGILPPGVAAGAMMVSSLTVVGNALRLGRVKL